MNYFEAQAVAKRNTGVLIFLFLLSVISLVAIIDIVALGLLSYSNTDVFPSTLAELEAAFNLQFVVVVSLFTLGVIALGSLVKTMELRGGGRSIAEALGGRLIPQNSNAVVHKRILNVVAEMAIASGTPVPSVYLLEESSINAFAAGWSPNDAVIGVTRGAVTMLTRDELQGVVAHEFSHIFNGDMRMNIRLMGIIGGIVLLGEIGYYVLRASRHVSGFRSSKDSRNAALIFFAFGLLLFVAGYIGVFFGKWIKAVISRQREYLADAAAVQYTRNPSSIAGALKKIGGGSVGSLLMSPAASQYSHAYFSKGVSGFLFSTHPPLKDRIRRIQPNWNGRFVKPKNEISAPEFQSSRNEANKQKKLAMVVTLAEVYQAIDRIGHPTQADLAIAQDIIAKLPDGLKREAYDPYGARAVVYALLLHADPNAREDQWVILKRYADTQVFEKTQVLFDEINILPKDLRLPLFELCFPAIRALSKEQYLVFQENIKRIIVSDNKLSIDEWIAFRLLKEKVDDAFGLKKRSHRHNHLGAVKKELEFLLSALSYLEHSDQAAAHAAFDAAKAEIGAGALTMLPREKVLIAELDKALNQLADAKPLIKRKILRAAVACLAADNIVTAVGNDVLHVVASSLDCPLPPLPSRL
ncbi:MAG: M48 family metallopeptidase [Gammaproteobacteria bacterium]|nr:M48 family metallopeptidase [Gammaproteobacteria bacterium]